MAPLLTHARKRWACVLNHDLQALRGCLRLAVLIQPQFQAQNPRLQMSRGTRAALLVSEQFWSATAQKGIVPTRTHQEPSPGLQQNDKYCLKTRLLKALLVNGSLGKTVNTRHAVQLLKSSALPCAWAKPGSRRNQQLTKDAQQDFSNDAAPWPCCQQKLLGNGSDFCYWCKTPKPV